MAVLIATFTDRFPEFATIATQRASFVQARLDTATRMYDASKCGAVYEDIVYQQAAHLLGLTPHGGNARLNKFSDRTIYSADLDALKRTVPVRMLTT